jgi:hypothetical protein
VQTVSNGANIYKSAFAGQMDDVVLGGGYSAWPSNGQYTASSDYFVNLVTSGVMSVSYDFFSARGLDSVKSADSAVFLAKKTTANAWNLVLDLDKAKEGTTFLYTKNGPAAVPTTAAAFQLQNIQPFQLAGMVAVLKGGSAFSLKGNQLTGGNMNPGQDATLTLPVVGP